MTHDMRPVSLPPFPPEYRASGLLLHCYVVAVTVRDWRRGAGCGQVDR